MTSLRTARPLIAAAASLLFFAHAASATTLYDPGLNTLPSAQGWTTAGSGTGSGSQTLAGGVLVFDSTGISDAYGNGRVSPVPLDTHTGFRLSWDMRLRSEVHTSDNRAGFSVLMQGADQTKSLELGFWADSVWALKYDSGGADSGYLRDTTATASFDTTAAMRPYTLTVLNDQFSLSSGSATLLTGVLRDYPTLGSSTLPYSVASFLFFGDNSSRGVSVTDFGSLTLAPIPEPGTVPLLAAGLIGLVWWRRRAR